MDVDSQHAMACRTRILEYPIILKQRSNRGRSELYRIHETYKQDMLDFTDYWYNHPDAGVWFNAPFMTIVEEPTPNLTTKSTIPSVGEKIAKDLYVIDPSNPEEVLLVEQDYYSTDVDD
jgi:hypothetical protein